MVRIGTVPLLVLLVAVSWGVPVWEFFHYGQVSIVSFATATMFTAMLVAFPFLTGRRLHKGHPEKAAMCRDCHNLRWPTDFNFGFCIHCGSVRATVRVTA